MMDQSYTSILVGKRLPSKLLFLFSFNFMWFSLPFWSIWCKYIYNDIFFVLLKSSSDVSHHFQEVSWNEAHFHGLNCCVEDTPTLFKDNSLNRNPTIPHLFSWPHTPKTTFHFSFSFSFNFFSSISLWLICWAFYFIFLFFWIT